MAKHRYNTHAQHINISVVNLAIFLNLLAGELSEPQICSNPSEEYWHVNVLLYPSLFIIASSMKPLACLLPDLLLKGS